VLLTNVFFHLARSPEAYNKLRREILHMCSTEVTFNHKRGLAYLQHVLNKTFRLNPTVGQNARIALQDTIILTGGGSSGAWPIYVTKGTVVRIDFDTLYRRSATYGDDVEAFRPER
jgi:cytochrome P450